MRKISANKLLTTIAVTLFLYMPFHLFLSRWLSTYTGGLMAWETGKDFLSIVGLLIGLYIFFRDKMWRRYKLFTALIILMGVYAIMHLQFLIAPQLDRHAVIMGSLYNGRFFVYVFIGMIVGLVGDRDILRKLPRWMLILSTITVVIALLQYVLPKDLMTHFGYSVERGAKPNFFIDDKPEFPRVMSTIRDPNSYAAFLVLPLSYLWAKILTSKNQKKLLLVGLFGIHGLALFLTFSRGGLLGAILSLAIITFLLYKQRVISLVKKFWPVLAVAVLILLGGLLIMRDNDTVQNVVFHSDEHTMQADPNQKRAQVYRLALGEIVHNPAGHSPGTAGLIAISNKQGGLITENYYLQVAYEIGIFGFLMYIAMVVLIYLLLVRSTPSHLQKSLLASFWGYAFIALLIHLWSNEAVALQWWLLAGVVIGVSNTNNKKLFG